jgi:hypothetical protein
MHILECHMNMINFIWCLHIVIIIPIEGVHIYIILINNLELTPIDTLSIGT